MYSLSFSRSPSRSKITFSRVSFIVIFETEIPEGEREIVLLSLAGVWGSRTSFEDFLTTIGSSETEEEDSLASRFKFG